MDTRNYYRVTAKCGHVGRSNYFKGAYYVRAEDKKEAAAITRYLPRVKHDHEDAILSVEQITYEEYVMGEEEKSNCPYWSCKSRWQQGLVLDKIVDNIYPETRERHVRPKEKSSRMAYKRPGKLSLSMYETLYDEDCEDIA